MSSFADRFARLGDEAEGVFESVWPTGWARFGLNRPPIQVHKLPVKIRYMPDYVTSKGLIECQGFGRDQVIKLKTAKLVGLQQWHAEFPTELFLWDSKNKRWAVVGMDDLNQVIAGSAEVEQFEEGITYWAIKAEDIPSQWNTRASTS